MDDNFFCGGVHLERIKLDHVDGDMLGFTCEWGRSSHSAVRVYQFRADESDYISILHDERPVEIISENEYISRRNIIRVPVPYTAGRYRLVFVPCVTSNGSVEPLFSKARTVEYHHRYKISVRIKSCFFSRYIRIILRPECDIASGELAVCRNGDQILSLTQSFEAGSENAVRVRKDRIGRKYEICPSEPELEDYFCIERME